VSRRQDLSDFVWSFRTTEAEEHAGVAGSVNSIERKDGWIILGISHAREGAGHARRLHRPVKRV
jgi:hypothetical protein